MAWLVLKEGPKAGEVFEITGDECIIGRGQQCNIRILDPSVSRIHATVFHNPDGSYSIKDNGSSYGTYINDQRITAAQLTHKAYLKFGTAVLEFRQYESDFADLGQTPLMHLNPHESDANFTILHVLSDETVGDDIPHGEVSGKVGETANIQELLSINKRLRTAYDISEIISSTFDLDQLFKEILKAIFYSVRVERASILLVDELTGEIDLKSSMDSFGNEQKVPYSHTIVKNVVQSGKSLLLMNAQDEETFVSSKSIFTQDIRSAMCVPLRAKNKIIGVINADATGASLFAKEDLQLLTLIGNQAGIVIHNVRLFDENIKAARLAAVGQTMASLAHCIKNILSGLKGASYMVDEGLQNSNQEMLTAGWPLVKESQHRITELVMNMLDYSKERAPAYEKANLKKHMENIYELMKEKAKERRVNFYFEYDDSTPLVDCDPMAIYRAVLNLVTNAIDAVDSDDGKVRLQVKPAEDPNHILIGVADNGHGIPPEVKKRLFEAFYSTKSSKGTGLGLAVTKKIIDEHKGEIGVKTKVDKGTIFTIKLPVIKPA